MRVLPGDQQEKEQAIREASSCVSPLHELAPRRWCYYVWSPAESAWLPGLRAEKYAEARRKRASSIAALAASSILRKGKPSNEELAWDIVQLAYSKKNKGSVKKRLGFILRRLPPVVTESPARNRDGRRRPPLRAPGQLPG